MTETERIGRWLADLLATLDIAAELAKRGRDDFDSDVALLALRRCPTARASSPSG